MVAVIHTSGSLRTVLNYNENKVKDDVAECIYAGNYPKESCQLSFNQKLNRLADQAALRPSVKRNCIHISLNFDPSEKLSTGQLQAIAVDYLEYLGFAEQPFLIYRHYDSGHPHVHILTTNIKNDGTAIKLHNLGKTKSEQARRTLENKYNLVPAEGKEQETGKVKSAYSSCIEYGKSETKRSITNVLSGVINTYCYGSVTELNALLGLYNVEASRGDVDSRIYKNNGLVYRILDSAGKPVGVPIKASLLPDKPTLAFLEGRFTMNRIVRRKHRARVRNAVDMALLRTPKNGVEDLVKELGRQGIDMVLRRNQLGELYGVTYVDHVSKCVFNGSDLGKNYSSNAIRNKSGESHQTVLQIKNGIAEKHEDRQLPHIDQQVTAAPSFEGSIGRDIENFMETLLGPEYIADHLPWELRNRLKRKKKRKRSSDGR
ncbi:relaxase/mobilization nuclease domain-containing protein [Olivibacter sp. XZL3]|uniref:relaxase/mobilization nuclease domain-containing protein n=1 Tax=Olivibacter sp. XZL3 TaxID=1735116 RepID=UPI0010648467|nr:relaxase/mobilization nuclease domain-containing protein [Olivibacter sp. XZL3]